MIHKFKRKFIDELNKHSNSNFVLDRVNKISDGEIAIVKTSRGYTLSLDLPEGSEYFKGVELYRQHSYKETAIRLASDVAAYRTQYVNKTALMREIIATMLKKKGELESKGYRVDLGNGTVTIPIDEFIT